MITFTDNWTKVSAIMCVAEVQAACKERSDVRHRYVMQVACCMLRGGDTVLKVGDKFRERSEQKIFFDPPLFGQWRDKIRC